MSDPPVAQMASAMAVLERQLATEGVALTDEQQRIMDGCEADFLEFLPHWTFVNRETGELEKFEQLWEGQRDFAELTKKAPWIFALKAGKLGFTELECAYDGWILRFKKNARVHVFSRDASAAEELLGYVKLGLSHLPEWMRLSVDQGRGADIDRSFRLNAGPDDKREIVRYAAGASVSIDQTATHSHVDELARMPYTEQTWTAVETTISPHGGTCHIVTRGAGNANYSADLWHKALQGDAQLVPFFCPWWKRKRPEGWYDDQKARMTPLGLKEFCPETWEDAIGGPGMDAVVPLSWIEAALKRQPQGTGGTIAAAVDVARFGRDMTAMTVIEDNKLFAMTEWGKTDTMTSVGKVRAICDEHQVDILAIDDTGIGGAITDRLVELYEEGEINFEILPVNNGTRANEEDRFHNKGSETWWRVHESLDPDNEEAFSLPQHHPLVQKLASQLQKAQHTRDSRERIWVDKTGMKGQQKRVGDPEPPSPDLADALALALEAWSNFWDAPKAERRYHGRSFLSG